MKKLIESFGHLYAFVKKQQDKYLQKVTTNFVENYELAFKEQPSTLQIKRFRQDHILKVGLTWFVIGTTVFFLV